MRRHHHLDQVTLIRYSAPAATIAAALVWGCAPAADPSLDPALAAADSLVREWVDADRVPGAVLHVRRGGAVALDRAYGFAQRYAHPEEPGGLVSVSRAMTTETVFDLASVTKVMATTLATMLLVDRGRLELDEPVSAYLPDYAGSGRETITVRQLLTHRSGLPQWLPVYYHASDARAAYAYLRSVEPAWPVGEERHYSDLGFMLLGLVVEEVSGATLPEFVRDEVYRPLGLDRTGFRPTDDWFADRGRSPSALGVPTFPAEAFAATSHGNPFERRMVHDPDFGYRIDDDPESWDAWRRRTLVGEVNDGNAFHAFQGVAGHAGLFATASELGVLLELLLGRGTLDGRSFIDETVVDLFLASTSEGQALGWQVPSYADETSFAHTGFTGTFVLGDRGSDLAIVLLTNRQNVGVDDETAYPDVGPLQRAVTAVLLDDIQ